MFSVSAINVSYPGKDLFKNVSFVINQRDRIGLTGKNGSGKTTLLNIIARLKSPDSGTIVIPESKTLGYLPQELKIKSNKNIYEETLTAFEEVTKLEKEIDDLNHFISQHHDVHSDLYLKSLEHLNQKYDRYNYLDGNKKENSLEKVLKGLGFKEDDFKRNVSEFSGGWQMRIELAKILLKKPDLLLLDEPTNHLDIESILWLEDFLINYSGAVVIVSHDKMFIDNICKRTLEIVFGKIYDYPVKFSDFLVIRNERYESQLATARNQGKFIEQQEKFIKRFKAKSTKARQVQSKMKMLDKIEKIELDVFDTSTIRFFFPNAPKSGKVVVEAEQLCKNFDKIQVLKDINFVIEQFDRVAFVGRNGEGKSTLVKVMVGEENFTGILKPGYNVEIGYYAQIQERSLDENKTVLSTLEDIAGQEWNNTKIRSLLGAFLFKEEDTDKKVKVLSGGEKSRLALAKLLLKPTNFLILDEPTNHLDFSAKEVLKKALLSYKGTLVIVSHDREFLRGLTNKTFEFRDNKIKEYIGGIDEFLEKHKVVTFREFEQIKKTASIQQIKDGVSKTESKNKFIQKKENERDFKKIKNELKKCENEVSETEKKINEIELLMQTPEFYVDHGIAKGISENHNQLKKHLEKLLGKWEEIHNRFDAFDRNSL